VYDKLLKPRQSFWITLYIYRYLHRITHRLLEGPNCEAGNRPPTCHHGFSGSVPGHYTWDLWRTSDIGTDFSPCTSVFPCKYNSTDFLCSWIHVTPELCNVNKWQQCVANTSCVNTLKPLYTWMDFVIYFASIAVRPPLWSSGQSFWLQIQRSRVRYPALPDFLSSSGSGTGSTQPREVKLRSYLN